MRRKKRIFSAVLASAVMILLILDAQAVAAASYEGITLCIQVVIPALFPFFVVTTYLNASLSGMRIPVLHLLGRILHIPSGGEYLLLLGLIGGYPVGAQMIADTYRRGQISKRTGQILLGYCSNAGPAFIFGMAGAIFSSLRPALYLWAIHILSAVFTGLLLPRPADATILQNSAGSTSIVNALHKSISVCASVCGWIILFRVILAYVARLGSGVLQTSSMILLTGILELSNGCFALTGVNAEVTRFVLCSVFLAFGGLCVLLQTMSVVSDLGMGLYLIGKLMQVCISLLATIALQYLLFPSGAFSARTTLLILPLCFMSLIGFRILAEKSCGNPEKLHV